MAGEGLERPMAEGARRRNAMIKTLLAEVMLDNRILMYVAAQKWARPEAVAHLVTDHGVSQRHECKTLAVDRSNERYRSVRPADDDVPAALNAVASVGAFAIHCPPGV